MVKLQTMDVIFYEAQRQVQQQTHVSSATTMRRHTALQGILGPFKPCSS